MAQVARKQTRKVRQAEGAEGRAYQSLDFAKKNWILFGAGLACISGGFLLLAAGDITIAPILLVTGYLGLIPWALVTHARRRSDEGSVSGTGE
ncbi:MAG: hypothetical protein KDA27_01815 [Candidatus Eisenbacteria bacterium]|uniref:DUF3098 domain-containing protein n=1 Tax=Eiseniibacteriota bacterium TaxID=2212470 RepID=A0A956N8C6_UNCEI|nr:hypothetical protein [Candidatus Eisenbacteria bacterium]MCB9463156.1 hypothetical protein [Candidatus Eisenbacteria bacterium]